MLRPGDRAVERGGCVADGSVDRRQPDGLPATAFSAFHRLAGRRRNSDGRCCPTDRGPGWRRGDRVRNVSATVSDARGSLGPFAAVALLEDDGLQVWLHSQGPWSLKGALAEMLGFAEESIRVTHVEGAGCLRSQRSGRCRAGCGTAGARCPRHAGDAQVDERRRTSMGTLRIVRGRSEPGEPG